MNQAQIKEMSKNRWVTRGHNWKVKNVLWLKVKKNTELSIASLQSLKSEVSKAKVKICMYKKVRK